MDALWPTVLFIHDDVMTVEPAIEIIVDQFLRSTAAPPETKSVDASVSVHVEGGLLPCTIMPCDTLRNLNGLPCIRPRVALAPDQAKESG